MKNNTCMAIEQAENGWIIYVNSPHVGVMGKTYVAADTTALSLTVANLAKDLERTELVCDGAVQQSKASG